MKKLYRSDNRMLGGVCAGVAEYFDIDPTLVRIAVVVATILGLGSLIIGYVIGWIIIPARPTATYVERTPPTNPPSL